MGLYTIGAILKAQQQLARFLLEQDQQTRRITIPLLAQLSTKAFLRLSTTLSGRANTLRACGSVTRLAALVPAHTETTRLGGKKKKRR
jgi:hypothetical protein